MSHPAHDLAAKARDAMNRCRAAEWDAGRDSRVDSPLADRAAREVSGALADLVKLATGVDSSDGHWAEERVS